jgi:hypothetical protein
MPLYWTGDERTPPRLARGEHRHLCARDCGAYWVCRQRDCGPCEWVCPTCELYELDDYLHALATETEQNKELKP